MSKNYVTWNSLLNKYCTKHRCVISIKSLMYSFITSVSLIKILNNYNISTIFTICLSHCLISSKLTDVMGKW